jgi:hypothetical protein
MPNDFVNRLLSTERNITAGVERLESPSIETRATVHRGTIISESGVQKNNYVCVILDDSSSVGRHSADNDRAMTEFLAWGKTEETAALVDLAIYTSADSTICYGPERFSEFSLKPKFRYYPGSYGGDALMRALDFIEENRTQYKRIGLVFVHDYGLHDVEVFLEQAARVHAWEKKFPTTFAVYPVGIGVCDELMMSKLSSKRKGRLLTTDYSLKEVIEFIKQFTRTMGGGRFPQD